MKIKIFFTINLFILVVASILFAADNPAWDKTFKKSDKVFYQKVFYKNRYGITICADMYLPKNMDNSKKYPAIVIGTPYGGVKEQGAGIYAQEMAKRGFVAIAFDESFNGESSGEPRHLSSPDIFVEDFSAGVDYLGTRSFVDKNKIGAIGLCGSGAFAVTAAQVDKRIKAVATASMYDMSRVIRKGWKDSMSDEQRSKALDELGKQRWEDFQKGSPMLPAGFPDKPAATIPKGLNPISSEFFEYYAMKRGNHPRSHGPFTKTSNMSFMNFPLMNYIKSISPRPILFIIGEKAHSRYFTEDAYKMAGEPKELYIVPVARHIDLYDRTDMIPFNKLDKFFTRYLIGSKNIIKKGDKAMKESSVFPKGNKGPKDYFIGTTYVNMLHIDEDKKFDVQAYDVRFEPSARTYWHSHPGGQILFITSGNGYYQEKGKSARLLKPGDVVAIPPHIVHWHGAAPKSEFVHLGISSQNKLGPAEWMGPVTDKEYKNATADFIYKKDSIKKQNSVFSKGNKGPEDYFTGTTYVNMLHIDEDKKFDVQAYDVRFEPSARTYWHSHPGGQILFITSGNGYYQEKGKPAQLLKPGDVVAIPPHVVHWHGAAPKSEFVHLGISSQNKLGPAEWMGPVTDAEYKEATAK